MDSLKKIFGTLDVHGLYLETFVLIYAVCVAKAEMATVNPSFLLLFHPLLHLCL